MRRTEEGALTPDSARSVRVVGCLQRSLLRSRTLATIFVVIVRIDSRFRESRLFLVVRNLQLKRYLSIHGVHRPKLAFHCELRHLYLANISHQCLLASYNCLHSQDRFSPEVKASIDDGGDPTKSVLAVGLVSQNQIGTRTLS